MGMLRAGSFPKPRNDDKGGRGTRNMGMLRAGSFPKPRNDDKGGRGCRKQARRQPHPFAMTGTGRGGKFVLNFRDIRLS